MEVDVGEGATALMAMLSWGPIVRSERTRLTSYDPTSVSAFKLSGLVKNVSYGEFGGAVQRLPGRRRVRQIARREHDAAAAALLPHRAPAQLDEVEYAAEINVQDVVVWLDRIPVLVGCEERLEFTHASVGERHVDAADLLESGFRRCPI